MSGLTGTWTEQIYSNRADFTAFNSSASEGSIISGLNEQPCLPALFLDGYRGWGRTLLLEAQGVLGTTSTPTITFQVRMSSSQGTSVLSGASFGVTAAITTAATVTNQYWYLRLLMTCYTPGQGSGNTTITTAGYVMSPGGFASPFVYALEPTAPPTATWTQTIDNTVLQYFNLSVTWSSSNASNTITTKQCWLWGPN